MTYTYINNRGLVIRDSDGKVVSPCQSRDDIDFIVYNDWVNAGNEPTVVEPDYTEIE